MKVRSDLSVRIPRVFVEAACLRAGAQLEVFLYDGTLQLIPVRRLKQMRGFLKRID